MERLTECFFTFFYFTRITIELFYIFEGFLVDTKVQDTNVVIMFCFFLQTVSPCLDACNCLIHLNLMIPQ